MYMVIATINGKRTVEGPFPSFKEAAARAKVMATTIEGAVSVKVERCVEEEAV